MYIHMHIYLYIGTPQTAEFTIDTSYEEYLEETSKSDISKQTCMHAL